MPEHWISFEHVNAEGWVVARCHCGWVGSPCDGMDDAADNYGDHRARAATEASPDDGLGDMDVFHQAQVSQQSQTDMD